MPCYKPLGNIQVVNQTSVRFGKFMHKSFLSEKNTVINWALKSHGTFQRWNHYNCLLLFLLFSIYIVSNLVDRLGLKASIDRNLRFQKFLFIKFSHIPHCLRLLFSQTLENYICIIFFLQVLEYAVTDTGLLKRFIFWKVINWRRVKFKYYDNVQNARKQFAWR